MIRGRTMIENKKYYSTLSGAFVIKVLALSILLVSFIIFSATQNESSTLNIVIIVLVVLFNALSLFVFIQVKSEVSYIKYSGSILYMTDILGKEKEISLKNDFDVKVVNERINYIVIKNENGKTGMLIGANWKEQLESIKELLEVNRIIE